MVKKGEIEMLGEEAQKLAIKLKVEGLSHSAIAARLNEKFNADTTENQIAGFLKRKRGQTFNIMKEERDFDFKLAKWHFDTLDQLKYLNKEMWNFFLEIKKTPELKDKIIKCSHCGKRTVLQMQSYGLLIKAADHLLKQIEHQDKVLGRLKEKGIHITYNMVDMSKKVQNIIPTLFRDAERMGDIKIIKKKKYKDKKEIHN